MCGIIATDRILMPPLLSSLQAVWICAQQRHIISLFLLYICVLSYLISSYYIPSFKLSLRRATFFGGGGIIEAGELHRYDQLWLIIEDNGICSIVAQTFRRYIKSFAFNNISGVVFGNTPARQNIMTIDRLSEQRWLVLHHGCC